MLTGETVFTTFEVEEILIGLGFTPDTQVFYEERRRRFIPVLELPDCYIDNPTFYPPTVLPQVVFVDDRSSPRGRGRLDLCTGERLI